MCLVKLLPGGQRIIRRFWFAALRFGFATPISPVRTSVRVPPSDARGGLLAAGAARATTAGSAAGTAGATRAGSATGTAGRTAARRTRAATARTAGTIAAPRPAWTATIFVRIAGRARQHPAATSGWNLARSWLALPGAGESLACATTVGTAISAPSAITAPTVVTAVTGAPTPAIVAPATTRARHLLDDEVELAALLGRGRWIFAGEHADHPKVVDPATDHFECIQQPRQPIASDADRRANRRGIRPRRGGGRWLCSIRSLRIQLLRRRCRRGLGRQGCVLGRRARSLNLRSRAQHACCELGDRLHRWCWS